MDSLITVRPYTDADKEELLANAKEDGHGVFVPTHVLIKNNRIVGYWSMGVLPLILSWQDSKRVTTLDSVKAIGFIEGSMQHLKQFIIPCDPESPYEKSGFLKKNGYIEYTIPVKLYIKQ